MFWNSTFTTLNSCIPYWFWTYVWSRSNATNSFNSGVTNLQHKSNQSLDQGNKSKYTWRELKILQKSIQFELATLRSCTLALGLQTFCLNHESIYSPFHICTPLMSDNTALHTSYITKWKEKLNLYVKWKKIVYVSEEYYVSCIKKGYR